MPTYAGGGGADTAKAGRVWHKFLKHSLVDLPHSLRQSAEHRRRMRRLGR